MKKLIASWQSVKPEENRFRVHSIHLGEDLWGEEVLVKRWERIGGHKRENYIWPDSHQELMGLIKDIKEKRSENDYKIERGILTN